MLFFFVFHVRVCILLSNKLLLLFSANDRAMYVPTADLPLTKESIQICKA
jgi:hypothetical protein